MAAETDIEWCDSTFNPWIGCTRISPACDHCYAAVSTPARTLGVEWGAHAERRRTSASNWKQPLRWEREHEAFAEQHGRRRRVFCASLADVFDNEVPQQWRDDLFGLISATPHIDWLILTKRIGNVGNMLPVPFDFGRIYPNVWLGITVCNQTEANRDIPKLLELDARVRFLSIEPMLGPIALRQSMHAWRRATGIEFLKGHAPALHWVICGGESGPHARPMHPDWPRSLRDQCATAGVPFIFKQWGGWRPPLKNKKFDTTMGQAQKVPAFIVAKSGTVHCFEGDQTRDGGAAMLRVGKKAAGRLLDGVVHDAWPEVRA